MKGIGRMLFPIATIIVAVGYAVSAGAGVMPSSAGASKRVLFVVTSHDRLGETGRKTGFYLPEVAHPYAVLTKAGFSIDIVSPKGGAAPIDGIDPKDAVSVAFLSDPATRTKVDRTLRPEEIDPSRYDAIFFAGGHGTMWDFPNDRRLAKIAASISDRGGVVAAVCHGPAGLINIKLRDGTFLVSGKKVAAFTNAEEAAAGLSSVVPFPLETKLTERGALVQKGEDWKPNIVVDGKLVTGQNPASAEGVAKAMAAILTPPAPTLPPARAPSASGPGSR